MIIEGFKNDFRLVQMVGPDFKTRVLVKIDVPGGLNSTYVSVGDHPALVKTVLYLSRLGMKANRPGSWGLDMIKETLETHSGLDDSYSRDVIISLLTTALRMADKLVELWEEARESPAE